MSLSIPVQEDAPSLEQLARRRRATPHFAADPVPAAVIEAALRIAAEAPSGYNLQPWRFILVRDAARRARLREAAFDQAKITEAPLVIVACAEREGWQRHADEIFLTRAQRTGQRNANLEAQKKAALGFVDTLPREVWLNRHVMIGFTYLMLAFESLGCDTAPMEGFSAAGVRAVVGLPDDAVVVALLAVGRATGPEPAHPGRLSPQTIAFAEQFGRPFHPPAIPTP
jgi:nitroreductase